MFTLMAGFEVNAVVGGQQCRLEFSETQNGGTVAFAFPAKWRFSHLFFGTPTQRVIYSVERSGRRCVTVECDPRFAPVEVATEHVAVQLVNTLVSQLASGR